MSDAELLCAVERELTRRIEALPPSMQPPPPPVSMDAGPMLSPNRGVSRCSLDTLKAAAVAAPTAPNHSLPQAKVSSDVLNLLAPKSAPADSDLASTASSTSISAAWGSCARSPETERVRVVLRIRPFLPNEAVENCTQLHPDDRTVTLSRPAAYDVRDFAFDRVLAPSASQYDMFGTVAQRIVDSVLEGYHGTILAYGQTGTGKTYTVFGREREEGHSSSSNSVLALEEAGILPISMHYIFDRIAASAPADFRVTVSCVEIYLETVLDLLDLSKTALALRDDPRGGVYVQGLTHVSVTNANDALALICQCAHNRIQAATRMNQVSSRSHVVISVAVEQRDRQGASRRGVLTVVDLAGSERVGKSGSAGKRLDEAKVINKSLSALGKCVYALSDPNCSHIPFRDSKLTRLLSSSLGGNAKTCLVATIGPSLTHFDDSVSTLLFATRAMAVQNAVVVNEELDPSMYTALLEAKLRSVEAENSALSQRLRSLEPQGSALSLEAVPGTVGGLQEKEQLYLALIERLQSEVGRLTGALADSRAHAAAHTRQALAGVAHGLLDVPEVRDIILSVLQESPGTEPAKRGEGVARTSHSPLRPHGAPSAVPMPHRNSFPATPKTDHSLPPPAVGTAKASSTPLVAQRMSYTQALQRFYGSGPRLHTAEHINGGARMGPAPGQPLPPRKGCPPCDRLSDSTYSTSFQLLDTSRVSLDRSSHSSLLN
eukprot:GGOE01062228.1.p1 GENE.GGOE01062228.1~~GGOE01062228.1.p1  ORF type:complete len:737 (+),score=175.43 GGOE01062228.1:62-2212(+)